MGILSSITSAISDPGKLVSEVADAILPSGMKGIGEAIGGIVDLTTGHPLQALSHLSDALKDLPQLTGQSGTPAKAVATPAGTAAAEPSPPPARSLATVVNQAVGSAQPDLALSVNLGNKTLTISESLTSPTALNGKTPAPTSSSSPAAATTANGSTSSASASNTTPTPLASVGTSAIANGAKQAVGSAQPSISLSVNLGAGQTFTVSESVPAASTNATSGKLPVAAPAATGSTGSAPATSTTATTPASATASSSATSATDSTTKTGATSTSSSASAASAANTGASASGTSGAPASLASLMAMSPDQFMQAVTSGQIPPDVADNQSAMMQVQARMNSITQMNQLVTSMMTAMHQMQMSIIQNIRC